MSGLDSGFVSIIPLFIPCWLEFDCLACGNIKPDLLEVSGPLGGLLNGILFMLELVFAELCIYIFLPIIPCFGKLEGVRYYYYSLHSE